MAEGYGFGAEGDRKTAIPVRAASVMGTGLPGGPSLMEDYTYDLTPGDEHILGAHMLEAAPSLTTATPSLEVHPLSIGGKEGPVRLVFTADPGPAVLVAMSDLRDRFRLVANVVEIVEPTAPLPKLPVGRAVWKPAPDFTTSATAWLEAGGAHHTVMTTAVTVEAFEDFARMARTELLVIDESDPAGVLTRTSLERRLLPDSHAASSQPALHRRCPASPVRRPVGVLEDLVEGYAEDLGDLEGHLQGRGVAPLFDGDDGLPGHADSLGQLGLGHLVAAGPQHADPVGDPGGFARCHRHSPRR